MSGAKKCSVIPQLIKELTSEGANLYTFLTDMTKKLVKLKEFDIPNNNISLDYSISGNELPAEDLLVVAPCTFNTLNKIANGISDSYPLSIIASTIGNKKKVIIAPAMNGSFWNHPITLKSLETIQQWGGYIVWPEINPEKVTMAPLEKIADNIYNHFNRIRYESNQLPSDNTYQRCVEENFSEFRETGELLLEYDLIRGSAGFLSKKIPEGILISASGSNIGNLTKNELSLVKEVKDKTVIWQGEKHPSSETPLIIELYQKIPSIKSVIHAHNQKLTYDPMMQKYASSEYLRYGKFGESDKIINLLNKNDGFAVMKLHGEICVGDSLFNASKKLEDLLKNV